MKPEDQSIAAGSHYFFWRRHLAAKFVLLAVGLTAFTLGTTAWFSFQQYRQSYLAHLQSKTQTLARFVASISPDRIVSLDFMSLHNYVKELSDEPDVVFAVVVDEKGLPLTDYISEKDPYVADAIRTSGNRDVLKLAEVIKARPDIFLLEELVKFSDRTLGRLVVGVTRRNVEDNLRRVVAWNITGGAFVVFVLSLGIYAIFRIQVSRPTQLLMEGAKRVAHGDLTLPIPLRSEDELGRLARSFNDMMRDLSQSNRTREHALGELQDLNRTLEMRVDERTRAIESVNRELERLALSDALTDLPNRTLFMDRLRQTLNGAKRKSGRFAVMLIDLDRFKEINDTFGHHAGDQLLKDIASRLTETLLTTDTVGRLGGDEFAIILPDTDSAGTAVVARRLIDAVGRPVELEGVTIRVAASIGIANFPETGHDANTMLKCADIAMYEAKQQKTGYCFYQKEIDTNSPRRLTLMADLRQVVEQGKLQLHYQVITDTATGAIRGAEALTRWYHPVHGYVSPERFIPMIEQTGLVRSFSQWLLTSALEQWTKWNQAGRSTIVSVNVSMRNLQDREFTTTIAKALDEWRVPAHGLILEITESAVMSDPEHVLETLEAFKALGVGIAIDDFGTGYSSLSYLKRFPVQEIKIDRSFVSDMAENKEDATIVRSIIDLAHNLGRKVVAEGVENVETLMLLRRLGCDLVQGYYLGRPMPAEDIDFKSTPAPVRESI